MITYDNFEKIVIGKPVERVGFISAKTEGKIVLDVGCYDETALSKKDTGNWLHQEIIKKAKKVIGIDNSNLLPVGGISDAENSHILKIDAFNLPSFVIDQSFDVVVAGEFIEHIENHFTFLSGIKDKFKDSTLIISTPNGMAISNFLMGMIRREAQHPDHLHLFSYKTLYTLFARLGYGNFEIIPYHFYATEMILRNHGIKRFLIIGVEKLIKILEIFFPLNCMGYIVIASKSD